MFRYFVTYLHIGRSKKRYTMLKFIMTTKPQNIKKKSTQYSETKRIYYRKSSHKYPKHTTNITDELICLTSIKYKFGQMYLKTSHSSCLYENQKYRKATGKFHLLFSQMLLCQLAFTKCFA